MEEIKKAINGLEQALISLETALLQNKKDKELASAKVDELKKVIRKITIGIGTKIKKSIALPVRCACI